MPRNLLFIIGAGVLITAIAAGFLFWPTIRGMIPAFTPPPEDIGERIGKNNTGENETGFPLRLPEGFSISILANNIPGARVMAMDSLSNLWVSQTSEGQISLIELDEQGNATSQEAIFSGLNRPHGIIFDPANPLALYIAETNKISYVSTYTEDTLHQIAELPGEGRHVTRTIGFGPDGKLYVSIGSSCDVCIEQDERRAAMYRMNKDGSEFEQFAKGLRNAVFFTWHPETEEMWTTEMGRDQLGDDLPPDEINIIREGNHYGWPYCYGKQIRDAEFNSEMQFDCSQTEPSHIDLQAHSSSLELAFVPPNSEWPEGYWYDLFVAYHGSWNRTVPTGYKLVRIPLDEQGHREGEIQDFISGWLQENQALGRPADVLIQPDGTMYVSDDHAGLIYKVTYQDEDNT